MADRHEDEIRRMRRRREDDDEPRRRRRSRDDEDDLEDDRPRREGRGRTRQMAVRPKTSVAHPIDIYLKIGVAVFLVVAIVVGFWLFNTYWNPFKNHILTYVNLPDHPQRGTPKPIRKYVVVNVREKALDGMHSEIPYALRANWPEEVTTVVRLSWGGELVGRYEGGGVATRVTCFVTVYDLGTGQELARQTFKGSDPPGSILGRKGWAESRSGSKPWHEVIDFLKGLAETRK